MINLEKETTSGNYEFPTSIDEVMEMSGLDFEDFVYFFYKKAGYNIIKTDATNDHGIDLKVTLNDKTIIGIQCKRWSSPIRKSEVTKMLEGKEYFSLDRMMLITTSNLTQEANIFARNNNIEVKTLSKIKEMLEELKYLKNITFRSKRNNEDIKLTKKEMILLEKIKNLRTALAKKDKVPAYIIFSDKTLFQLTVEKPTTIEELVLIKGLGKTKIEKFGNLIIKVIKEDN